MVEPDEIQFTCSVCGKEFPADPDTMVESGYIPLRLEEGEGSKEVAGLTEEDIKNLTPEDLIHWGITPEQHAAMLKGELVPTGASCICKECQDELLEDGEEEAI